MTIKYPEKLSLLQLTVHMAPGIITEPWLSWFINNLSLKVQINNRMNELPLSENFHRGENFIRFPGDSNVQPRWTTVLDGTYFYIACQNKNLHVSNRFQLHIKQGHCLLMRWFKKGMFCGIIILFFYQQEQSP